MPGNHGSPDPSSSQKRATTFQLEERSESSHPTTVRQGTDLSRRTSRLSSIRRTLTMNLVPEKKIGEAPGLLQSIRAIITASCTPQFAYGHYRPTLTYFLGLNLLLVFIPVSVCSIHKFSCRFSLTSAQWVLHFVLPKTDKNDTLIFVCAFTQWLIFLYAGLIYSYSLFPGNYSPRKGCP